MLGLDESVDEQPFMGRFSPYCWVALVLVCPVVFFGLSFRSVSQARHLLGAILRLCVVFCSLLVGAGFDSPAKLACWCTSV